MSYNIIKKSFIKLDDKLLIKVLELRHEIEHNAQHRGTNYEICLAAYTEIRKGYGHPPPNSSCRSGCIRQMNKILSNWFISFDANGGESIINRSIGIKSSVSTNQAINAESNGNLIPLDVRRKTLMGEEYDVIIEQYLFKFGSDEHKKLNNGRKVKKEIMVNKLLGV